MTIDTDNVGVDLDEGDYLYQSDQELFLVVTSVNENSHEFAVHGWREIADYRLDEYLSDENGELHRSEEVENLVQSSDDPSKQLALERLTELFEVYGDGIPSDGPHESFRLEDGT